MGCFTNMLVKDIDTCKECPVYMKFCSGDRDVLINHCIEPPCAYLNAEDDMEREVGIILRRDRTSHEDDLIADNGD